MKNLGLFCIALLVSACTTINVDHVKLDNSLDVNAGDAVVVLGRHHSAEFETEPSLIRCIGSRLQKGTREVRIIPEHEFVDMFYPWFEARTAPMHPKRLQRVLDLPLIAERIEKLNIRFFVWVEGSTERTNSAGTMTCSIGPGGGGCFGFGTWEDTSEYETVIWNIEEFKEVGRISTDAVGTSYMPAFVVPIPLLAQVEGDACKGMGSQLVRFFNDTDTELKQLPGGE
ncbi:MAG: hypothetical protein HKN50_02010 [Gammaproteobacteria bacterium]|nr:hypothetical protein [Gammaproteobacteria bacterium]